MPITWDAEADRKLLLAILDVHDFKVDTAAVANKLSTDEQPCTSIAIQRRLQRIKALIKEGSGAGADGDGTTTPKAKSTPRKQGATTAADGESPTKKGKGGKGKGKGAEATTNGVTEDDDEIKAGGPVKQEEFDDIGEI